VLVDRSTPESFQPPLTWWGHAWRLLVMLALTSILIVGTVPLEWREQRWLFWIDVVVGLGAFVLVHFRRRWPVAVPVVIGLLGMFSVLSTAPGMLAMFSLATRRRWREIIPVGAVTTAALAASTLIIPTTDDSPFWVNIIFGVLFLAIVIGWGMYVGSRRELVAALHQRAERAEAEQGLRALQARTTERARIAREMHDVLAHRISQISMRAGALAFREDLDADSLRQGAAEVQQQANEALVDLRSVLGVLRDSETGELLDRPQPTYDDVAQLLDQARTQGLKVELDDGALTEDQMPHGLGRTVYRILQEGVTNAGKHAPGATLAIRVAGSPDDGLSVELRNPLGFGPTRTPGAALGLLGLSERAELRGGWLRHRVRDREFVVEGWLPWTA
jgi:signal transduction histidine kinase